MRVSNKVKYELLDWTARICAALPPIIAAFYYFPEWIDQSPSATFSGMLLVVMLVSMVPFWKKIAGAAKKITVTSMPIFWLVAFAIFWSLKEIIDKFVFISLFGFAGSLLSMVICFFRNRYKTPEMEKENEVNDTNE